MKSDRELSLKGLGWKLGVSRETLEELASDVVRHYRPFDLSSGAKVRTIENPIGKLRLVQRKIHRVLLRPLPLPAHVQGSVKWRSSLTNAKLHLGRKFVVRVDLKDFFPNITHRQVYSVWSGQLNYIPSVARLLTILTTFRRHLPQGAPTSSALANLLLLGPDQEIFAASLRNGCTFSRFVDDIVFSGDRPQELIGVAFEVLQRAGFHISRRKLEVMSSNARQEVTGLTVNSLSGPSVPRYRRDQVRAAIDQFSRMPKGLEFDRALSSIRGRILHIAGTNSGSARALNNSLDAILGNLSGNMIFTDNPEGGAAARNELFQQHPTLERRQRRPDRPAQKTDGPE